MNVWVEKVGDIVVLRWGPNVALVVPEYLHSSVYCSGNHVGSYIEFASVIKQQIFYVRLDHYFFVKVQCCLYLIQWWSYYNSLSSVWVLGRLYNPDNTLFPWVCINLFKLLEWFWVAFLEVICEWYDGWKVLFDEVIIHGQIIIECVFIAKHKILFIVVMDKLRSLNLLKLCLALFRIKAEIVSFILLLMKNLSEWRLFYFWRLSVVCGRWFFAWSP